MIRRLHQRRYRQRWGLALGEGWRVLDGLVRAGAQLESLWTVAGCRPPLGMEALWERLVDVPRFTVSESVFKALSDTVTPQGILGVFRIPSPDVDHVLEGNPLLLVLDGVQDPGNAGTLVRSALAVGASGILAGSGTVDLFSPRAVRAAAGMTPACPIISGEDSLDRARRLVEMGGRLLALDVDGERSLYEVDWRGPIGLIIGSEGAGVSGSWNHLATERVRIPMAAPVESLNAAVSGAICLYEAFRQRRAL